MNNKYQTSLQQKRTGKVFMNFENDITRLFKIIKQITVKSDGSYDIACSKQVSNSLSLIRDHIIKPNLLMNQFFMNLDLLYICGDEDKASDINYMIDKFLENYEKSCDPAYKSSATSNQDFTNLSLITLHLHKIGECLKPESFISIFNKLCSSPPECLSKALPHLSKLLSEFDSHSDAACLFAIIQNKLEFFQTCFKNNYDWRTFDSAVTLLKSSVSLYNNEAFTDKIVTLNKEFYFGKKSASKLSTDSISSVSLEVKGGSRGNSNKEIHSIEVQEATQLNEFVNSRNLKSNIELSIFLIKIVSMKMREEIIGYVEKYLTISNYYSQRYIIFFYEQILVKYSFEFFNKSGMLSNLFKLLSSSDLSIKIELFELCKRIYPFISNYSHLNEEFDEKIRELEEFTVAGLSSSNKKSLFQKLRKELNEIEVFKANANTMNFEGLFEEDQTKYESINAIFEERNCFYLFTKANEIRSPGISYLSESAKKYQIESPNKQSKPSTLSSKKRVSSSFKGIMDAQIEDRPFSPPSLLKSSLGPIKTSSVKKIFRNSLNGNPNKQPDLKIILDPLNVDLLSKVKGTINNIRRSEILKPIKGIERLEIINLNVNNTNSESNISQPKLSSSYKKYSLRMGSKQGSQTSIESKLIGAKISSSNKTISSRK